MKKEWFRNDPNDDGKFCVWYNFTKASLKPKINSISLCTHGSIGYSKFVFDYVTNWKSSISVSLLIDENALMGLAAYKKFFSCYKTMSKIVTSHIVWKKSETTPCNSNWIIQGFFSLPYTKFPDKCDFLSYKDFFHHQLQYPYPPNTMRNIARNGSLSNIHLIADIENHFSENAAILLSKIAENVTEKTVVGIRRFEYETNEANSPKNPKILKELLDAEKAVQFHYYSAGKAHLIPDLDTWLNYSIDSSNPITLNPLSYPGFSWEPQLIVFHSHPYHFEGFPIRFTDQQALPYELCRANANFTIVSHVFSFHEGIKRNATDSEIFQRINSTPKGEAVSSKFTAYLNMKYPKTEKVCGGWRNKIKPQN
uniref:Glycosyltransferase family 92 protein n=1 Tax=Panagrolaimus superbus TaxID=310955 RepID=A0A914Y8K8_9BILA